MKHFVLTGGSNVDIPLSTPPPSDPVTEMLRPVQTKFTAALNELSAWRRVDIVRENAGTPDCCDHLNRGLSLILSVGQVGNEAHRSYGEALAMLDLELEQLDCDAIDPTLERRTREEIANQRKLVFFMRNAYEKMVTNTGDVFDRLSARLFAIQPVRHGAASTKH